jgi:hypothetical protein
MIKNLVFTSILLLTASIHAQSTTPTPTVNVTVDSETKDLARGFAQASSLLSRPPVTLAFQKEGTIFVLEDVRSV